LISCPEYAGGIPGSFKNALDWLVGSLSFPGKLVAIFNASPRASEAQAALRLVLATMSARLVDGASISVQLLSKGMNAEAIATDSHISGVLVKALHAFAVAIADGRSNGN
jgi:chromate reductase